MNQTPPYSPDSERAVLGSILQEAKVMGLCNEGGVGASHFYVPENRIVFEAMIEMSQAEQPIDLLTVASKIRGNGDMGRIGNTYLTDLVASAPTTAHSTHHINVLHEKHKLRKIIKICHDAEREAYKSDDSHELCGSAISELTGLFELTKGEETSDDLYVQIREGIVAAKETGFTGLAVPWGPLNDLLGGLDYGALTLLAGDPSAGKSTICINIAEYVAETQAPVCYYQFDGTADVLWRSMVASRAEVNLFQMRKGVYTDDELQRMDQAHKELSQLPIHLATRCKSLSKLRAHMTKMADHHGVKLFVIDYVQLVRGARRKGESRSEELGKTIEDIKDIGSQTNAHIIALSQLSRPFEKAPTKSPTLPSMRALRDSGALEQAAVNILMIGKEPGLDIDTHFRKGQDWPMRINIEKAKFGPQGFTNELCLRGSKQKWDTVKGIDVESWNMEENKSRYAECD